MLDQIIVPAPAKINLHLAVGSRRTDGFHAIASIFQAVSLYDTVTVTLRPSGGLILAAECGCPAERNTAWKAAAAYLAAASESGLKSLPGISIVIDKQIPMGAGLGGGSSDAASTLLALSLLLPGFVDRPTLLHIAATTGSDVPFFLGSACAAVTGRGEYLSPLESRTDYVLVIVNPGFHVSTRDAYKRLDASRKASSVPGPTDQELIEELRLATASYSLEPPDAWNFRNDFFNVLIPDLSGLEQCRQALLSAGADFAALSGSGSSVFGVFASRAHADRAFDVLSGRYSCTIALPLAKLQNST
jgi:4-diphosphocytidyl-2-C-methyl-D-erythritol kinase